MSSRGSPRWAWTAACAFALQVGCGDEDLVDDVFTSEEWSKVRTLSPLPELPADPTNEVADDAAAAKLGQRLFFEKGYSGPLVVADDGDNGGLGKAGERGKVSCASCHQPSAWFQDVRSAPSATSLAVDWTGRNAPTVVNSAFYDWFFWDGRADAMWIQALGPSESAGEMAGDRLGIAHVIFEKYRAEYEAVFGPLDDALDPKHPDAARFPPSGKPKASASDPDGPWELMAAGDREIVNRIFASFGKAIAAYERLLVSRNAPFDRYVAGETGAIGEPAKRGLKLFVGKAGCVDCHSTPLLSDNDFHNDAVVQSGAHVPEVDTGRYAGVGFILSNPFNTSGAYSDDPATKKLDGLAQRDDDKGKFRTKHIRQIAETAPYMHTGQLATLMDVVEYYDQGNGASGFAGTKDARLVPLNLASREKSDLVAFLQTLTGDPIPEELTNDTSEP